MNNIIASNDASKLQAAVYGMQGTGLNPIAVDPLGKQIFSSPSIAQITAENFDIRNLSAARDRLSITARDLDIRNLNGSQDSINLYNRASAEASESGFILALATKNFLTRNVSMYRSNTYDVVNQGGVAVTINLQLAPIDNDSYYINDGGTFNLLIGSRIVLEPSKLMKYARIRVSTLLLGSVSVYYLGQA
jgi:hypothetical protein